MKHKRNAKDGRSVVTIYDIAKKAGVSAMTVSRVINNTGRISEETRSKVKRVMDELNYVPNTMARSLVLQETKMLSLLITDITNPFYTTLARGAEDTAKKLGYKLLFGNSDEDLQKEKDYVDMVLSTRVDGVLFAPAGDGSLEHLRLLQRHHIPFVILDREVPGIEADAVFGDSKEGARKLVEHLIGLGHRRIALVNGSLQVSTARQRYTGYLEALKLNDLPVDERLILEVGYKTFDNDAALDELLSLPDRPTAIFAANNFIAIGLIRSLRERGIGVPDDMSLVCFDDLGLASALDPFLTVAAQPAYSFGAMGVQLLVERIRGEAPNEWRKIMFPSEIIVRRSAAAPKGER
jgi:LacI family transcriptional regulator